MDHQVTHKQHYVWRKYLEPWGNKKGEKVFVWWNNHKITKNTDVFDILRENDFYEYKPLNKLELYCLKNMFAKTTNDAVKSANSSIEKMIIALAI